MPRWPVAIVAALLIGGCTRAVNNQHHSQPPCPPSPPCPPRRRPFCQGAGPDRNAQRPPPRGRRHRPRGRAPARRNDQQTGQPPVFDDPGVLDQSRRRRHRDGHDEPCQSDESSHLRGRQGAASRHFDHDRRQGARAERQIAKGRRERAVRDEGGGLGHRRRPASAAHGIGERARCAGEKADGSVRSRSTISSRSRSSAGSRSRATTS